MCFAVLMRLDPLKLRRGDRSQLEAILRSGTVEARLAQRARIIVLAADGWSNRDIAETVGMHYNQVGIWRKRYVEFGLAGLSDEERTGRPHIYGPRRRVVVGEARHRTAARGGDALDDGGPRRGHGLRRRRDVGLAGLAHLQGARSE